SGAQVSWVVPADDDEPVSTSFVDLPLTKAIERLLPTRSFELVVSSDAGQSRLKRIVILPSGRHSAPQGETAPPPPARQDRELEQAPLDALDDMLRAQETPAVRLQAVSQLATLAERDPEARTILAQLSTDDADDTVRESARQALDEAPVGHTA